MMVSLNFDDIELVCETKPDLFSPKSLDQGTALLLKSALKFDYKRVLDWGCGWGAIGLSLAANRPEAEVYAIDANIGAVSFTQANAARNELDNLIALASDSYSSLPAGLHFDLIAANPPTHQGREVVDAMIAEAPAHLADDGRMIMVVEARLKPWVQRDLQATFGNVKILDRGPKNVVLVAQKQTKPV